MGKRRNNHFVLPPEFAYPIKGHYHFIQMDDSMLNSPAYITLSLTAKAMYTILRQEYKGIYTEQMTITCPYQTFIDKGISRNSIPEAVRLLEAMGFIACKSGGLGNISNRYRFLSDWRDIDTMDKARAIKKQVAMEKTRRKDARKAAEAMYCD